MLRLVLAVAALGLVLTACEADTTGSPTAPASPLQNDTPAVRVTPGVRPGGVPVSAQPVIQTMTLGTIVRRANEPPEGVDTRRLVDASCEDGAILLRTASETVYAARSCDGFWDEQTKRIFVDQELAIVLEVTSSRLRILIETLAGGQAEFTVDGLWLE